MTVAPKLRMQSELGDIDEGATKKAFERARPALLTCFATGLERVDYLAGEAKFFIRVKPDGHLRWAFLEQSTIGDRATEKCMVGALTDAEWPRPEGGEAEVHQGLAFDPPSGVRAATDWSGDRVAAALAKKSGAVSACKTHGDGTFQATAYVKADHGAGHVVTSGASAPSAAAAADIDCLLGVVSSLKLPNPGSYPAKVSFSL